MIENSCKKTEKLDILGITKCIKFLYVLIQSSHKPKF